MGKVVVLGGNGAMGARVVAELQQRGHDVVAASRASGVDAVTGAGLAEALTGASCVVDCLNLMTMSRRRARGFFAASSENVRRAAADAGVGHIVCLTIVNASEPRVRRALGYYEAKATQEEIYARGPVPLTVVRTTAWFSLAETFLTQIRVGRVALVPRMGLQPVHPDAAATAIADAVDDGPPTSMTVAIRELAGPERMTADALARRFAAVRVPGVRVIGLAVPLQGLRVGLLPSRDVPVDGRRLQDWLDGLRDSTR